MAKNVLFSNYYDSDRENYIREWLMESRGEDNPDWETLDDIPDEEVWEEMDFNSEIDWEDTQRELRNFFEGKTIIVVGKVGRWNGTFDAGKVISYNELYKCWNNCDYVEIYDEDGHMHISSSHHDGTNHFEVKVLTEKGVEVFDNWEYDCGKLKHLSEQEIHEKLFGNSRYSHIPHFAREVYGCKTR